MAEMETQSNTTEAMKRALLLLNIIILSVGNCGGPLITRLYFVHGGKRVLMFSPNHRLATYSHPDHNRLFAPPPHPSFITHQALLHKTSFIYGLCCDRNPKRPRRLHLRLRHGSGSCFDFCFDHRVPVGFHCRFRFPFSEAEVYSLLD
ncbi:hypothetical protein ACOSQ2_010551 [Xanthoceras sorbifolium]